MYIISVVKSRFASIYRETQAHNKFCVVKFIMQEAITTIKLYLPHRTK